MRNIVVGAALLISGLMGASANAMPMAPAMGQIRPTSKMSITHAVTGTISRPAAFAVQTGPRAMSADGIAETLGRLVVSGGNIKLDVNGTGVGVGNSNKSGADATNTVDDVKRPARNAGLFRQPRV